MRPPRTAILLISQYGIEGLTTKALAGAVGISEPALANIMYSEELFIHNREYADLMKALMHKHRNMIISNLVEGVLILRNISLKFKTVVDNAILLNYAVSSENISESIKIKREFGFLLKVNVCKFR